MPWKSKLAGGQVKSLFKYQELMKTVAGEPLLFGPWATLAGLQASLMDAYVTGPIKTQARIAVRAGRNPDIFAEMNSWIYQTYARLLYNLCSCFIKNGKFDRQGAQEISSSEEGKQLLRDQMKEFRWLELSYNSRGLTRLKAMKDLLKSILVLITEQPIEGEDMPFMKKNADGTDGMSLGAYLEEGRARVEALWRHNAFDIRDFADRFMGGKIGYLPYEVIKGSRLHTVRLRYYPLPKDINPNGKVVYIVSPMINLPEIFDLAEGKSVVEGMLKEGYHVYLVDHGDPGPAETNLGLEFYGKTVPDTYIEILQKRHPGAEIHVMGYCMAGTLMLAWLARRAEERLARKEPMDIWKIAVMASPVKFDDGESGHSAMRKLIREEYDPLLMKELFGEVNVPPQVIEAGMNEIQPGVQHTRVDGFLRPCLLAQRHRGLSAFPVLAHPRHQVPRPGPPGVAQQVFPGRCAGRGHLYPALLRPGTGRQTRADGRPRRGRGPHLLLPRNPRPDRPDGLLRGLRTLGGSGKAKPRRFPRRSESNDRKECGAHLRGEQGPAGGISHAGERLLQVELTRASRGLQALHAGYRHQASGNKRFGTSRDPYERIAA